MQANRPADASAVARVKAGLANLNYDPGAIDGVQSDKTTAAIKAYQHDNGLAQAGRATLSLSSHIERKLDTAQN